MPLGLTLKEASASPSPPQMAKMKTSVVAIQVVLLMAIVLLTSAEVVPGTRLRLICYKLYMKEQIALARMKNYQFSTEGCGLKGIVFMTIQNRMTCVDPNDAWVQDYMHQLPKA